MSVQAPAAEPTTFSVGPLRFRHASLLGAWLGVVAMVLSVTPSLVPRGWAIESVLAGLCFALLYGIGALISWVYRTLELPPLPGKARRVAWMVLFVATPVALLVGGWLGRQWQIEQRELLGMETDVPLLWLFSPALGVVVALLVLGLARAVYWLGRTLSRLFRRLLPGRLAAVVAVVLTVWLTWSVASGLLVGEGLNVADTIFKGKSDGDKPGVVNPESDYRSGGPNSALAWEGLGREGRAFVWSGQTAAQIADVTGDPDAEEPVRVFVSLESGSSAADRAAIAVEELRRLGGFDRRVLAVAGGTGSGWVDPKSAAALEYVAHGDVATATTQYSYLPSWMSYLVDVTRAQENAEELLTAIRVELDSMDPADRPELYVYGESLGSFSTGSAFTSVEDMSTTTDGALMIGPPNFEPTWMRVQERRDPSSPIWKPRYHDGALARTATVEADLTDPSLRWETDNRIVYLTHASDPIVAWQIDKSEWLDQRGDDVHPMVNAIPLISGLQGTLDQLGANSTPPGHGHVYDEIVVPAWSEILGPPTLPIDEVEAIKAAVALIVDPDRA
ncbi:MAG TPA: alpha/beta-hydrolase family protein [Nocardioides sp.]|uniref:alpha/beta-hydrolase family protein n=1 Tax=Nocardioides sp. TaxID=35761 RepID=UPI002C1C97B0|nr:alpha/beta-hydrolase family protein [Nocardioides sp.]HQR25501.1 alpha/beta-hydrolase family protein [Nocardioides sp.]